MAQGAARGGAAAVDVAFAGGNGGDASAVPFAEQARNVAVLSLDGHGYQASLGALLTLGSVVVAQASLFPTWLDHYLLDGTHLRRASPGADGLRRHAAWAAAHPNTSRRMARAGRRRICQLRRPGLHMDATAQPPGAPAAGLCASRAPTNRATRRGAG